jgi:hypothetical protein
VDVVQRFEVFLNGQLPRCESGNILRAYLVVFVFLHE